MPRLYAPGRKLPKARKQRNEELWQEALAAAEARGAVRCRVVTVFGAPSVEESAASLARFEAAKARDKERWALVCAHYDEDWCLDAARLQAIPTGLKGTERNRAKQQAREEAAGAWRRAHYPSRFIDVEALLTARLAHADGAPLVLPEPLFVPTAPDPFRKEVKPVKKPVRPPKTAPKAAPKAKPAAAPVAAPGAVPAPAPVPEPAPVPVPPSAEHRAPSAGYSRLALADWQALSA